MPMTSRTALPVITILIFLLLGLGYSSFTPLWSPPDEELHFSYCEYIARNHSLPHLIPSAENARVSQAFHPPLYYLIGSLFCRNHGKLIQEVVRVNDGPGFNVVEHPKNETIKARSAHLLRFFTLLLSALAIYLIYEMVLTIFPGEVILAAATALFVGTIPQFLHISASISNEMMAVTLSTLYLFALLQYSRFSDTLRQTITRGLILGGCLLSKVSTAFLLPVTLCVMVFFLFRERKKLFVDGMAVFGTAALVAGWWYVANWSTLRNLQTSQPWFTRQIPFSIEYVQKVIDYTFTSFFGYFGSLQIPIKKSHLLFYGSFFLLGVAGICKSLIKQELTSFQRQALGILSVSLLGGIGVFIILNMKYYAFMGRYLFVVIAPIAIITCVGFQSLFPSRWRNPVLILLSFVLIVMNLDVLFRVLKPAYAETFLVAGVDQPQFCCPTPEINLKSTISQTFISPKNNLSSIRVMFSCKTKQRDGEMTFVLKESGAHGKILHQMKFPLKKIEGISRYFFIFPPIRDSMGKEYVFYFSSHSLPAGKGVSLWYDSGDRYPQGRMLVNGEPSNGDLYFQSYCFTGEHPETDWQGRREVVIDQGWYISIRELQLYAEMSKEFRVKTLLHEKLQRIEKALKNRISS